MQYMDVPDGMVVTSCREPSATTPFGVPCQSVADECILPVQRMTDIMVAATSSLGLTNTRRKGLIFRCFAALLVPVSRKTLAKLSCKWRHLDESKVHELQLQGRHLAAGFRWPWGSHRWARGLSLAMELSLGHPLTLRHGPITARRGKSNTLSGLRFSYLSGCLTLRRVLATKSGSHYSQFYILRNTYIALAANGI